MASVTGEDWRNVMNLPTMSDEDAEYILDLSIDTLNLYGASLSNMSGAAGSKTVTLTSKERGGVFSVARIVYEDFYLRSDSVSVGGASVSTTDLLGTPTIEAAIQRIASRLAQGDGVPFKVAEDTTGYE